MSIPTIREGDLGETLPGTFLLSSGERRDVSGGTLEGFVVGDDGVHQATTASFTDSGTDGEVFLGGGLTTTLGPGHYYYYFSVVNVLLRYTTRRYPFEIVSNA